MGQKYKVFTEKSGIFICDSPKNNIPNQELAPFLNFNQFSTVLENGPVQLLCSNAKRKFDELFVHFAKVTAAGGIIVDCNRVLLIYRNGFWDLPKGHVDAQEEIESAAVREVKEECGVHQPVEIKAPYQVTYHTYLYHGVSTLKTTHWFLMQTSSSQALTPQIDEGITVCKWVPIKELPEYLSETFISIRELLEDFLNVNTQSE